ncbi:MAG TPA: 50S ribosomal protein L30e [Methanomicrobia archaeon]|nr:50S ribosomal protein L30e [Methanomicrobia archaeon]
MAKAKRKAERSSIELSDVHRELQKVLHQGTVLLGSKETVQAVLNDEARVVIHASNCPEQVKQVFTDAVINGDEELIVYEYPANSLELGLACGKPYSVASLCITDPGDSAIVRVLTPEEQPKEKTLNIDTR